MTDRISRKALFDTIRQMQFDTSYDIELVIDTIKNAEAVDAVPAVHLVHLAWDTVEKTQRAGLTYYVHRCPRCNYMHSSLRKKTYNWCPDCGADMRDYE